MADLRQVAPDDQATLRAIFAEFAALLPPPVDADGLVASDELSCDDWRHAYRRDGRDDVRQGSRLKFRSRQEWQ
jgi:hypothetical protein